MSIKVGDKVRIIRIPDCTYDEFPAKVGDIVEVTHVDIKWIAFGNMKASRWGEYYYEKVQLYAPGRYGYYDDGKKELVNDYEGWDKEFAK